MNNEAKQILESLVEHLSKSFSEIDLLIFQSRYQQNLSFSEISLNVFLSLQTVRNQIMKIWHDLSMQNVVDIDQLLSAVDSEAYANLYKDLKSFKNKNEQFTMTSPFGKWSRPFTLSSGKSNETVNNIIHAMKKMQTRDPVALFAKAVQVGGTNFQIAAMRFSFRQTKTRTLRDTSELFGITRERVRQISQMVARLLWQVETFIGYGLITTISTAIIEKLKTEDQVVCSFVSLLKELGISDITPSGAAYLMMAYDLQNVTFVNNVPYFFTEGMDEKAVQDSIRKAEKDARAPHKKKVTVQMLLITDALFMEELTKVSKGYGSRGEFISQKINEGTFSNLDIVDIDWKAAKNHEIKTTSLRLSKECFALITEKTDLYNKSAVEKVSKASVLVSVARKLVSEHKNHSESKKESSFV